jgi:excisionase family DNA binding protein
MRSNWSASPTSWPSSRRTEKLWKLVQACVSECKGVQVCANAFVEDIHVSSNTCRDVQACANTGSVSDEKSKNVQIHASLSKNFAGSLLDGIQPTDPPTPAGSLLDSPATEDEALRSVGKLLTVRQVAKVLGVCPATVYRLCDRGELAHYRVSNAIRVNLAEVEVMLQRSRGAHHR